MTDAERELIGALVEHTLALGRWLRMGKNPEAVNAVEAAAGAALAVKRMLEEPPASPPALKTCNKCGFFTAEQHECERLRGLKPPPFETFREVPPASPLADLKGATERLEAVGRPPRADVDARGVAHLSGMVRKGEVVAGAPVPAVPPAPAALLREALVRAQGAVGLVSASKVDVPPDIREAALLVYGWLMRETHEAEAREAAMRKRCPKCGTTMGHGGEFSTCDGCA